MLVPQPFGLCRWHARRISSSSTVEHNILIQQRSWDETRIRQLAADRQKPLVKDEVKQERKQLAKFRRAAESGSSQTHLMWELSSLDTTAKCSGTEDRHEFPVGSLVKKR